MESLLTNTKMTHLPSQAAGNPQDSGPSEQWKPTVWTVFFPSVERVGLNSLPNRLLDAAEAVVVRQGIANLTLEAVAAEAGMSKGGLLHHFPTKDRLVEGLVRRTAENWRACCAEACGRVPEGPGRMARGLLMHSLSDAKSWTEQCRRSSSAVFAALAQNPALIEPMRAAYADLRRRIAEDGLPPGVGETVAAAIDGLWLYWVLGLVPIDQDLVVRVRGALEDMLSRSMPPPAPARANGRLGGAARPARVRRGTTALARRRKGDSR
jgi:AcrR family transcriptional regulator